MNPWRGVLELPRGVWVASLAMLVNRAGTTFLPFLVLYLTRHLRFEAGTAALMLALYGAGALVAAPLGGRLGDRFGPRRVMVGTLAASGLLLGLFPLARSPTGVAAVTMAIALTAEAFRPNSMAVVATLVPAAQRKQAIALTRLAVNVGMSIGPAVGGFLAERSFPLLMVLDGATSLAAAVVLVAGAATLRPVAEPLEPSVGGNPAALGRASLLAPLGDARLRHVLLYVVVLAVVFFQHEGSMPLYLVRDVGLRERDYGLLFAVNTLLIVALELPLNAATASWPARRPLALGALLFGVGFGALVLVDDFGSATATVVVWTLGEMMVLPALAAYVADIAPPAQRATYMGLYSMAFAATFLFAPALGTLVLDELGPAPLWLGMLAIGLLAALIGWRMPSATSDRSS